MIFRPKITNTNTNPNTITNINTNVRSMIFPFKITNQTQILDQWFSLSKSQTQTHIETNWTQKKKRKKKEKKWRSRWSEAVRLWARKMRGAEGCATVWDRLRWGWNEVERVESCRLVTVWRQCEIGDGDCDCLCLTTCGRVRQWVSEIVSWRCEAEAWGWRLEGLRAWNWNKIRLWEAAGLGK